MAHVIEPATSGRAKCRGCGERIAKDALRLGERLANLFGEGEMTRWFQLPCAAYKRPEPFLEALQSTTQKIGDVAQLEHAARGARAHRRLPRIDGAKRASSGRAPCRHRPELVAPRPRRAGARAHRRLPRIDGANRASSGRAHCRHCRELIEQRTWRICLVYYQE